MSNTGSELTSGLQSRLSSSLPLPARCRLAVNSFTSEVFIPLKEEVVLDWLLTSLDLKYHDRLSTSPTTSDDTLLWETLQTCLSHMIISPSTTPYKFSTVPEILLNILPHTDLSQSPIMTCTSHLLSLSSSSNPDHSNWSSLLSLVISLTNANTNNLLISSLHKLIGSITLDPSQDHALLVIRLSDLHQTHPHCSLKKLVTSLLFSSPDPYTPLFSHLSGVEGKYHPGQVTANLLYSLSQGCSPLLIMSSCPPLPAWLKAKLFSLLLSTQGFTGLVDCSTVEGGKLVNALKKNKATFAVNVLFNIALPLDLSVELKTGYTVAKNVQEVVKDIITSKGITLETAEIIASVHKHHPQLLEPLVGLILHKYLENSDATGEVFENLVDVMLKLRQFPKMISKLFLHLRSVDLELDLVWSESDLAKFGSALSSLPRVQSLEMWKTLNYHLTTDVLGAETEPEKVDKFASVLSSLLSTVLLHSQLADHNLPSSLLPRIQDLMETTQSCMETLFAMDKLSMSFQNMLIDVTFAISELSKLFVTYRGLSQFESGSAFAQKLAAKILENQQMQTLTGARRLLVKYGLENKSYDRIFSNPEEALKELEPSPDVIDHIPDTVLLKSVKTASNVSGPLLEHPRFCSAVVFVMLEKINKQENFYIPGFDQWRNDLASLDSYLGKSVVSSFTALLHSELPGSELNSEDLVFLGKLPLENLPAVLKLAATLACLSQVLRKSKSPVCFSLSARCMETTDLFRFVDAGRFLNQILALEDATDELIEIVAKSVGRFSKTIKDVDANFHEFEENVRNENNLHLKASVCLLNSLSKSLNEGTEGTDKKVAGKALADKISKHVAKIFKKRNLDNLDQTDLLCEGAAEVVKIYGKTGLGKMSKLVHKMVELSTTEHCKSWKYLLGVVCDNLEYLDSEVLPDNWKLGAWEIVTRKFVLDCRSLLQSLMKSAAAPELEEMLRVLLEKDLLNLQLWQSIISSEVPQTSMEAKKVGIEQAVAKICKLVPTENFSQIEDLPAFLNSVFSSSPPCVSTQLEVVCLGSLFFTSSSSAPACLSSLGSFLSHRGTLSTRTIPITTSLIRHFISPTPSTQTLLALQKVLGLFSRHKADYSSVLPYLMADLLHLLSSLPPQSKSILTTSIYPLFDMLDKHSFEYLSSNLPPATNEIFKHTLTNYNANHKFKGKV